MGYEQFFALVRDYSQSRGKQVYEIGRYARSDDLGVAEQLSPL